MWCAIGPQEEFRISISYSLLKGVSIPRLLRQWFTVVMRLRCNRVDGQKEVVSGDGACHAGRERQNAGNGFGSGSVFEDDAEFGKVRGETTKVRQKVLFGIED